MILEDKVVCYELSKALHEAGIVVPSYFEWVKASGKWSVFQVNEDDFVNTKFPAPLSCELAEVLPERVMYRHHEDGENMWHHLKIIKFDNAYKVRMESENGMFCGNGEAPALADAMAKMLLFLDKKGLL